jgi:hypothetical protein
MGARKTETPAMVAGAFYISISSVAKSAGRNGTFLENVSVAVSN